MSEAGKHLEGQVIDGKFPLLRYLGASDHSVVFLTERKLEPQRAAVKLIPAKAGDEETQISNWEAAAKLSHPHLVRLYETGRCHLGNEAYSYVLMEYADENLYQILPDRALTSEEAREMVPPVLDALRYLHKQGFVHGHIKPANIMASGDQVKLSSDGVVRAAQPGGTAREPSLYDPPEAAGTGVSEAGDTWSLGVTLVEVLTQHPPSTEGTSEGQDLLPQSLTMPFSEIVRNCLRRRPEQRWSLEQIAAKLDPNASYAPAPALSPHPGVAKAARAKTPNPQATFAKPAVLLGTSVLALLMLAFFFVKLLHRAPQESPSSSSRVSSPQMSSANQTAEPSGVLENGPQSGATPPTAPDRTQLGITEAVVRQVVPEVPRSASRTIHGTIRVIVKVNVDVSGDVSSANLVSPGSSAYFAKLALQSARKWEFAPANKSGQTPSSTWILTFEFRKSGTRAAARQAK